MSIIQTRAQKLLAASATPAISPTVTPASIASTHMASSSSSDIPAASTGAAAQSKCTTYREEFLDEHGEQLPGSTQCEFCPFKVAHHDRKPAAVVSPPHSHPPS